MSNVVRKYGWIRAKPDVRDLRYGVQRPESDLPAQLRLTEGMPPVYDQGSTNACFSGNTKVKLLNGQILSLKELSDADAPVWVYGINDKLSMVPCKAVAKKTGTNRKLIKLTLDNAKEVFCTPEHQFMLRDGSYKAASDLTLDDSLMPFNTSVDGGYLRYEAANYNHFVIKTESVDGMHDVYCMSVENPCHNFVLDAGVVVHNCTAHAWAAAFEWQLYQQKYPVFMPSRLFIYYNERLLEGTVDQDSGAIVRDGAKALAKYGTLPEVDHPFSEGVLAKPDENDYKIAVNNVVTAYLNVPQTEASLKTAMFQKHPVVFGFQVYPEMEGPNVARTGMVPMPKWNERSIGGHAVMLVGWDDDDKHFWVRNSWGASWGQQGYFKMPYDYVLNNRLSADFWIIISEKSSYKVVPTGDSVI